jgi:hypothetical protein
MIDPLGMMGFLSIMPVSLGQFFSFASTVALTTLKGVYHFWVFSEMMNATEEISNHITKLCATGQGGYDVTQKLFNLREDVINKWKVLNSNQKSELVNSLYNPIQGLVAWDIHSMVFENKKDWTKNLPGSPLEETLTFQGKVYPVAEVNYVLWGLINRLAYEDGFSYTGYFATYTYAYGYRSILGGVNIVNHFVNSFKGDNLPRFETTTGRMAWVYYGWQWAVNPHVPAPEHEAVINAFPTDKPYTQDLLWSAGGRMVNQDHRTRIMWGEVQ